MVSTQAFVTVCCWERDKRSRQLPSGGRYLNSSILELHRQKKLTELYLWTVPRILSWINKHCACSSTLAWIHAVLLVSSCASSRYDDHEIEGAVCECVAHLWGLWYFGAPSVSTQRFAVVTVKTCSSQSVDVFSRVGGAPTFMWCAPAWLTGTAVHCSASEHLASGM